MDLTLVTLLWVLAFGMAAIGAYIIRRAATAASPFDVALALFLLAMMASMAGGFLLYEAIPGLWGVEIALFVGMWVMVLGVAQLLAILVEGKKWEAGRRPSTLVRVLVILGALGMEVVMSFALELASGALSGPALSAPLLSLLASGVVSVWFLFPMSLEMGLSTLLARKEMPREVVGLLLAQSAVMFLAPPAFTDSRLVFGTTIAGSVLMIGVVIFLMEYLYRHRQLEPVLSNYVLALMGIYSLMMLGLFLWLNYGTTTLFATSLVLEMVLFFDAIFRPFRFRAPKGEPWTLRPHWTFGVLSFIFVAELFMGAVLDLTLDPSAFVGTFPNLPLSGSAVTILSNALSNGFFFLNLVTASTWFLAMMGFEMGMLVVFKFRETHLVETRVRLALMLASYAAFVVWFPSVYFSLVFPNAPPALNVPLLGWSMGPGSAPLAPAVFTVLFLTLVIMATLSILFGRRWVCSVFCMAPVMYQGTTIDAMSTFNRSSPVARKYLSSRFSGIYTATTGVVMASLVGVSFLSYFDQIGRLNVTIGGLDPAVFLFALSFNVMWYLLFVTIPYTGNYNCATMNYCYTGIIAQAFHKLGFYKLKVREKSVCQSCTTLDCAKHCPVGLVDMPGHFRQKGEFKSTKCCGVGDCAEVCPYDNLYLYDVRHWVRERLLHQPPAPARRVGVPRQRPAAPGIAAFAGPSLRMAGSAPASASLPSPP